MVDERRTRKRRRSLVFLSLSRLSPKGELLSVVMLLSAVLYFGYFLVSFWLFESNIVRQVNCACTQFAEASDWPLFGNMSCVLENFESMLCTWCPAVWSPDCKINWRLDWQISPFDGMKTCNNYVGRLDCGCNITRPEFRKFAEYQMVVKAANGVIVKTMVTTVVTDCTIVKPSLVQGFKVEKRRNGSGLCLKWKHPQRLEPELCGGLVYQLIITPVQLHDGMPTESKVIDVGEHVSYCLHALRVYVRYNLSVRVKPKEKGFWSEWRTLSVRTDPSVPSSGPLIVGFRVLQSAVPNSRTVIIFWHPVPPLRLNGVLVRYEVSAQMFRIGPLTVVTNASGLSARLLLQKSSAHYVCVRAVNNVGPSPSRCIYVADSEQMPEPPIGIVAERSADGSTLHIEWQPPSWPVSHYILYWCYGKTHITDSCRGPLHASTLPGNATETRRSDVSADWVFALSVVRGNLTGGMTPDWLCLYEYNGRAEQPSMSLLAEHERSITVLWDTVQCNFNNRGRPVHYFIRYYMTTHPGISFNVTLPASIFRHVITDLLPYTSYVVCMATESRIGYSRYAERTIRTIPSQPEDSPHNVTVTAVTSSQVDIAWLPPRRPNGRIIRYEVIHNASAVLFASVSGHTLQASITNLTGDVGLSLAVVAVTSAGRSPLSSAVSTRTHIGAPAQVDASTLHVRPLWNDSVRVTWAAPKPANGPLHAYVVFYNLSRDNVVSRSDIVMTTSRDVLLDVDCRHRHTYISLGVVAMNVVDGRNLSSVASNSRGADICGPSAITVLNIVTWIVPPIVAVAILCFLCWQICRYIRKPYLAVTPREMTQKPTYDCNNIPPYYHPLPHPPTENIALRSQQELQHQISGSDSGYDARGSNSTEETVVSRHDCNGHVPSASDDVAHIYTIISSSFSGANSDEDENDADESDDGYTAAVQSRGLPAGAAPVNRDRSQRNSATSETLEESTRDKDADTLTSASLYSDREESSIDNDDDNESIGSVYTLGNTCS